jgi:hypothetical protein
VSNRATKITGTDESVGTPVRRGREDIVAQIRILNIAGGQHGNCHLRGLGDWELPTVAATPAKTLERVSDRRGALGEVGQQARGKHKVA